MPPPDRRHYFRRKKSRGLSRTCFSLESGPIVRTNPLITPDVLDSAAVMPGFAGNSLLEPAGIEAATSCLQSNPRRDTAAATAIIVARDSCPELIE